MLSESELKHVCWLLSTSEKRQKEVADQLRGDDDQQAMYHGRSYDTYKETREFLEEYEVDVERRAEAYAEREGLDAVSAD